jgi:hypothetical protein
MLVSTHSNILLVIHNHSSDLNCVGIDFRAVLVASYACLLLSATFVAWLQSDQVIHSSNNVFSGVCHTLAMYFSLIAGFFKLDQTIHSAILFLVSLNGAFIFGFFIFFIHLAIGHIALTAHQNAQAVNNSLPVGSFHSAAKLYRTCHSKPCPIPHAIFDNIGAFDTIFAAHGILETALDIGVHNAAHCATDQAIIPICHHTLAFCSGVCRLVIVLRACPIGVASTLAFCSGVNFSLPCDCLYMSTAPNASFFHKLPYQATDCPIQDHRLVMKLSFCHHHCNSG